MYGDLEESHRVETNIIVTGAVVRSLKLPYERL